MTGREQVIAHCVVSSIFVASVKIKGCDGNKEITERNQVEPGIWHFNYTWTWLYSLFQLKMKQFTFDPKYIG